MPETQSAPPAPVRWDDAAIRRVRRRLLAQAEPPWLHQEIARRMADRIGLFRQAPRRVLDWSLAAGPLPSALLQACPQARLMRVASQDRPDDQARAGWWQRLSGLGQRPVQAVSPAETAASADLLWSNMALHLLPDPVHAFSAWHRAVAAQGFVMFSTIGPGSMGLLRSVYTQAGWGPPHGPLVDMHDLGDMLVEAGFADPVMDQETLSLRYASAESLLDELRGLGGNLAPGRFAACRGRDWRRKLLAALSQQAAPDGQLTLDIEVVYGHAFRAPDRGPSLAPRTTIDLAAMKLMLGRTRTP